MAGAIDAWVNPFTPDLQRRLVDDEEVGAVIKWWHMEDRYKGFTPEEVIALMDEAGLDKILIAAFQMYSFMRKVPIVAYTTEEIAEVVKTRPDRFAGLYGVNPYKRMQAVRELEVAVKEYGFKGAHIHTYGFGLPIDAPDYYPIYAKCVELGVPVEMQIGHSAEAMPSDMGRPIRLDNIALYFPELKLVAAHTGWPWCEELVALSWKHPNIYISTSAHAPKYWDKTIVDFINTRGQGKVMWATDWPVVPWKESIEQIEALGLKERAKQLLLHDVAAEVFKL
ncbi:amidohydrolase family protein [Chloroflexota bacterium]